MDTNGRNDDRTPSSDGRPTLVLGGTGKTGRRVADRLEARGLPVRIGSRSAEPRFDWDDPGTWPAVLDGVGAAYIAYYPDIAVPGAVEQVGSFARLAVEHGVTRLVLLAGRGEPEAEAAERVVLDTGADGDDRPGHVVQPELQRGLLGRLRARRRRGPARRDDTGAVRRRGRHRRRRGRRADRGRRTSAGVHADRPSAADVRRGRGRDRRGHRPGDRLRPGDGAGARRRGGAAGRATGGDRAAHVPVHDRARRAQRATWRTACSGRSAGPPATSASTRARPRPAACGIPSRWSGERGGARRRAGARGVARRGAGPRARRRGAHDGPGGRPALRLRVLRHAGPGPNRRPHVRPRHAADRRRDHEPRVHADVPRSAGADRRGGGAAPRAPAAPGRPVGSSPGSCSASWRS